MSPESISGTGQPGGLWRDIPGRRGLNGERRTEHQGRHPGNDGARRAKRRCALRPAFFCRDAGSAGHGAKEAAHPDRDAAGLPLTSDIRH
ncbi:hypothetical protein CK483_23025 [Klebsiella pneumoniae]|nr:hypothetical protein CK483_23025 [Klebsiella pneumoniae]